MEKLLRPLQDFIPHEAQRFRIIFSAFRCISVKIKSDEMIYRIY